MLVVLVIFLVIAVAFDFMNGFNDSANIVSTMISSRALSPRQALLITAVCELCGPFLFGVAVATTIGAEVLRLPPSPREAMPLLLAALVSAVFWNIVTWWRGIPSSSSHALIGGLVGSALADSAFRQAATSLSTINDMWSVLHVVKLAGLLKIVTALLVAPAAGFLAGYIMLRFILFLARGATPKVNTFFKRGQIVTAMALALSHGGNDAQKTMGIMTMGLLAAGVITEFRVPLWVVALSALTIASGTATGGWRLIRTLGGKFYKIRPVHGFTTQIGSAAVILCAALLGGPVSTSHVVSSAIMGAGSSERFSKVRWGVGKRIVATWLITIPVSAVLAALLFCLARKCM
jgi:inorganic phosphate transporter, PiT family